MAGKKKAGPQRKPKSEKGKVAIDLRLPDETLAHLHRIAGSGVLGDTLHDVANHVLREGMYRDWVLSQSVAPGEFVLGEGRIELGTSMVELHSDPDKKYPALFFSRLEKAGVPGSPIPGAKPDGWRPQGSLIFTNPEAVANVQRLLAAIKFPATKKVWQRVAAKKPAPKKAKAKK